MTDTTTRSADPAERARHAGEDGPAPAGSDPRGRRRMSAKRKQGAVLRLLRGEDLELVSRDLGVTAAELSAWREAFLAAGEGSLETPPADGRDVEIGRLKAKVGELTMANELLDAKIDRLETNRPGSYRDPGCWMRAWLAGLKGFWCDAGEGGGADRPHEEPPPSWLRRTWLTSRP